VHAARDGYGDDVEPLDSEAAWVYRLLDDTPTKPRRNR
jgi:hypothetical protein